ncbi:MAG TPA: STY0301 family protein [Xanthomonadales bacterium]|nr:STY0301 family protein [Xanthomonadales bacterium]
MRVHPPLADRARAWKLSAGGQPAAPHCNIDESDPRATAAALPALAATVRIECPPSIEATQAPVVAAIGEWHARAGAYGPYRLAGIGFSTGDPDRQMILAPDSTKTHGTTRVARFRFGGEREIWASCGYLGTRISMARAIGMPRSCTVTTDLRDSAFVAECSDAPLPPRD